MFENILRISVKIHKKISWVRESGNRKEVFYFKFFKQRSIKYEQITLSRVNNLKQRNRYLATCICRTRSYRRGSVKHMFPKNSQVSQEITCIGVSCRTRTSHWRCSIKNMPKLCFPVKLAKFLRIPTLKYICKTTSVGP